VLKPLSRELYPETQFGNLDSVHGYTVGYASAPVEGENLTRRALIPHTDDAEVTFNVCLTSGFEGGGLQFHGLRSDGATVSPHVLPHRNEFLYGHRLGRAIVHRGGHFHEVLPVTGGKRHVLILWAKSWETYRASNCPCCLKFNREAKCVCGPLWN